MHLSAETTAKELQELQETTSVDLITFTISAKTVEISSPSHSSKRICIQRKTYRLNGALMGFRSKWTPNNTASHAA